MVVAIATALAVWPSIVSGQSFTGELRIRVQDPQGLALPAVLTLIGESTQVHQTLPTDNTGRLAIRDLPYGSYLLRTESRGFAAASQIVNLHAALPLRLTVVLRPAAAPTSILVHPSQTLLDRDAAGAVNRIGNGQIEQRPSSLPGRAVIDLVNSEPGWLYEGNAVLHPRGAEYQTQFVVNGIPLTENRSPGFGSQISAADVQSMAVYTAGIPAEYGRKMGGIIEVNTLVSARQGLHGEATVSGGSFSTAEGSADLQYGWRRSSVGVSGNGAYTDWYENPPVLQNYTNNATTGGASGQYEWQLSDSDHLSATISRQFARFLAPNEQLQQSHGQRQHRSTLETMGTASWQHILSADSVMAISGMLRGDTVLLSSNAQSTPIVASQDRGFREAYLKGTLTRDWHAHEFKAGFEGDFLNLHEAFSYLITDSSRFDPGTPPSFDFFQRGRDREGAVFAEDSIRIGKWVIAPGLRWDDYSLIVHRSAFSPRLAVSRYFPSAGLTAHLSYDRVFQTPAFENILLSSSSQVVSLDPEVLRKPLLPSSGNYYEAGISKAIAKKLRLDANSYLRRLRNYADDNPLLDTSISFPISISRASIYGAEGKLSLPDWHMLSGYVSYSWMVGTCNLPATGGLFLGDQASEALNQLHGRIWISQDQRNTVRTRWLLRLPRGFSINSGLEYGSGLPVDFDGTREQALAQYGPQIVDHVNFARQRVDPSLSVLAGAAEEWTVGDGVKMRLQADGENLANRVNVIDFAGLFSGNAVAPPRSGDVSLSIHF
jgi:hypothetical protein